ncbi:DUF4838 domain-containing protein, partial [Bacteroidales bacterium OttesenSCG-928-E04]|nr:DUF4838 domain-containing protein [Bacteroidales bacterium OttesenSCG-928-E04]
NANDVDVPHHETVKLPATQTVSNPVFQYRETLFPIPIKSQKYADWHKLHNRSDIRREWGLFVHTYQTLIPAETYFAQHPEWFSEINGKRIKDGQLCLTNEEMRNELIQNLAKLMDEKPDAIYWSVSDNDNYNHCDCEACRKLDEQYGAASGSLLWFVNQVAAAFPEKIISTLGYQFSRKPPKNIKPAENVNIMLCSIECNRALPLAEDPNEEGFRKDVEGWTALTSNIFLWDYVVQFRNYFDPFPNLHVLQSNLKYFADQGIEMMFEQGSNMDISEFHELRTYLIAKLMWDPYQDPDAIIDDFLKGYYGDAAPFIRQYIDKMKDALLATSKKLNIYGYPIDAVESYLTPSLIKEYTKLFDQAEAAVSDNTRYADRVAFARMPLEFAILDLSTFEIDNDLSFFKADGNQKIARQDMLDKLDLFCNNCEKFDVKALAEWNVTPPAQFKENILNMIKKGAIKNLASEKNVELLTTCSPKYNSKGAAALTDGLFGFLDYRYHWLGFEGEDMEAIVDLGEVKEINYMSVNFLEVPLSWIFYPVRTTFYCSTDKISWKKVGELSNPSTENLPHYAIRNDEVNFSPVAARYVKVVANSMKTCPEWHRGYGLPCWIFADEIVVNDNR